MLIADINPGGSLSDITAGTDLPIHAANPHIVHLNIAYDWAASGESLLPVTGTIVLNWTFIA